MELSSLLLVLLIWIFYPLWLVAGFVDYLCHRRTDIAHTSGPTESWLHVAQFASLGIALLLTIFLQSTPLAFASIASAVAIHTLLSFADVAYTEDRRYISPLEQTVHGFMDVLPIAALGIVAALNWNDIRFLHWEFQWKDLAAPLHAALLAGSYFLIVGIPIFEELVRTAYSRRIPR